MTATTALPETSRRGRLRHVRTSAFQAVALVWLLGIVLVALLARVIAPHDPNGGNLGARLLPPFWMDGGSTTHLLGTDELGRDLLSRMMYGAQTSIAIALTVVVLTGVVGTALGLLAGYVGGRFDTVVMWVCDVVLSLPGLLLSAVLVFVLGASGVTVVLALSIEGWLVYCRLARGLAMTARRTTYVDAARAVGARPTRVMVRHILPNTLTPLLTLATIELARVMLAEAALSFLGLGLQPPVVSWGLMINSGGGYLTVAWWLITLPGLALALTVLSVNVVADWLRVASDPLARLAHR